MILEAILSSVKAPGKVNQGRSQESGQTKRDSKNSDEQDNNVLEYVTWNRETWTPSRNGQGAPATLVDKS